MHMLEQHMGQDHVSAQDQADENMAQLGSGTYLTKYKDEYLTVEMTSANQLTINPGSLLVNGRYCIIDKPEVLTVDNGSSGMTERDLVCVHWQEVEAEVKAASGDGTQAITKEEVGLVIVKGTPASSGATDPTISQQTIRSGVGEAWVPFARITKDGLTPSVALIVDKLAPESEFRTSIVPTFYQTEKQTAMMPGTSNRMFNFALDLQDGYTACALQYLSITSSNAACVAGSYRIVDNQLNVNVRNTSGAQISADVEASILCLRLP